MPHRHNRHLIEQHNDVQCTLFQSRLLLTLHWTGPSDRLLPEGPIVAPGFENVTQQSHKTLTGGKHDVGGVNNEYAHIMITLQNKIREHILPLIRVWSNDRKKHHKQPKRQRDAPCSTPSARARSLQEFQPALPHLHDRHLIEQQRYSFHTYLSKSWKILEAD